MRVPEAVAGLLAMQQQGHEEVEQGRARQVDFTCYHAPSHSPKYALVPVAR